MVVPKNIFQGWVVFGLLTAVQIHMAGPCPPIIMMAPGTKLSCTRHNETTDSKQYAMMLSRIVENEFNGEEHSHTV